MASDILSMRAHLVPIGEDNLANVELARELARRFDHMYAGVFPEPEHLVEGTLIGTDGFSKMSKSLNNAIFLSDSSGEVKRKVMGMYTDPNRISADTPGRVDGNPVFIFHEYFNPDKDEVSDLKERYQTGQVGDIEVKQKLARAINTFLAPIRERRIQFEREKDLVNDILQQGTRNAHSLAQVTLEQVRSSMGITNYLYSEVKQSNQYYQHKKSRAFQNLALV
jgi:tryptophanyl-tRNA synthetase